MSRLRPVNSAVTSGIPSSSAAPIEAEIVPRMHIVDLAPDLVGERHTGAHRPDQPPARSVLGDAGGPVDPGDSDGDGRADLTVFRQSSSVWYSAVSSTGYTGFYGYGWGTTTHVSQYTEGTVNVDLVDAKAKKMVFEGVAIGAGATPPGDAFTTVFYRNTWYWVSDQDFASKRSLTFLLLFFSLAETGVVPEAPVLTIPVQ